MNPLANIEFTQNNLDQIAQALNNRSRSEVWRLLSEKTGYSFGCSDETSLNYHRARLVSGIVAGAFIAANIVVGAMLASSGVRIWTTIGIMSTIGVVPITIFIISSVLYHRYQHRHQNQNIGTEEIKRDLANRMRYIHACRESNRLHQILHNGPTYHITQQDENLLNQYFGNQQPIVVN